MTIVTLENVTKIYGRIIAVDNVSLKVDHGEFTTLLGPSGCGKTTTLRIIAGFEFPDKGRIYFDDMEVTFTKPYHRNTAMVFQNYALWPHMTVYDNIAYGLRLKKMPEDTIKEKIKGVLELLKLEGLEDRYPLQLSGGQQQRVALARALVVEPRIRLLDEPRSNLDAKLRVEMRGELKKIQKKLKITTIYVTHDQIEALSMSDKIGIMNKGKLIQYGTPKELYFRPNSPFVADFLGRSNLLKAKIINRINNYVEVEIPDLNTTLLAVLSRDDLSNEVYVAIKPEALKPVKPHESKTNVIEGVVDVFMFLGDKVELRVKSGDTVINAYLDNTVTYNPGDKVNLYAPPDLVVVVPL